MVSLQKFLIGAVSFLPIGHGALQTCNCIPVRMATKTHLIHLTETKYTPINRLDSCQHKF